jgi:hypothetical protein
VAEKVAAETYELVVQDAVNDLSVPAHLLTREYNAAVKRIMKPDGVYLLTVIDSIRHGRLWRSAMRTLRETFQHVELISSVAVPPNTPPSGASEEEIKRWSADLTRFEWQRQVLVIYAGDQPLDEKRLRDEAYRQLNFGVKAAVGAAVGAVEGPTAAAVRAAEHAFTHCPFYTNTIPSDRLAPFLAKDPGVLLTDQYAPVDNLMAEQFRYRTKRRPDELPPDD